MSTGSEKRCQNVVLKMKLGWDETSINFNTVVFPLAMGISEQNYAGTIFCAGMVNTGCGEPLERMTQHLLSISLYTSKSVKDGSRWKIPGSHKSYSAFTSISKML